MPTQQLQQPSPIPEGFNIAAAVMDRAVWFHLANGGPASAREHIKTLRDELSYLYQTDCTPAYTAAMAKIVAAEEAERLEAEQRHMEQQSQLMLAMVKAMQTSQQPPRPAETQHAAPMELPPCLCTEEAMKLWQKAQEAGLIDDNYQPTISRTKAALLAYVIAKRLGIQDKWKVFEKLWMRNNMRNDYNDALYQQQTLKFQEKLKTIFAD